MRYARNIVAFLAGIAAHSKACRSIYRCDNGFKSI
jgi:hypothetical protein